MGCATLPAPGIDDPASPASIGGAAPKSRGAQSQKFVLSRDVVLTDPVGSAIAS
jgi:hypothetical protein